MRCNSLENRANYKTIRIHSALSNSTDLSIYNTHSSLQIKNLTNSYEDCSDLKSKIRNHLSKTIEKRSSKWMSIQVNKYNFQKLGNQRLANTNGAKRRIVHQISKSMMKSVATQASNEDTDYTKVSPLLHLETFNLSDKENKTRNLKFLESDRTFESDNITETDRTLNSSAENDSVRHIMLPKIQINIKGKNSFSL